MYLVDVPPPTISGNKGIHIGHIFSYTQGDIIADYHRYIGENILYPFCFDNNGIPTGRLASKNNIHGTENIVNFSIGIAKNYENTFTKAGIKFSHSSYYTFDENSVQIAHKVFELLKTKGVIYKGDSEFLWSEKLQTSISQSELNEEGLIEKTGETPVVKFGEGYFINIKDHLNEIKKMSDSIIWKPERYKKRIDDWIGQIKYDWSISRTRNFGIPIPGETGLTFDTWFISSLTPQLAMSSIGGEDDIITNFPVFDIRYQAHDIIRSWAFYTIAMSYFLNNNIPWKTIMITGHVLDGKGNKETKSNGNSTNPIPLIDQYGIAGIRHWACANALGTDTKIDIEKMKMGWKMINKFANARKFVQMQIDNSWIGEDEFHWEEYIIYKPQILKHFDDMELNLAQELIYKFFWNIFCDVWIESSKKTPTSITLNKILDDFEPVFKIIYKN